MGVVPGCSDSIINILGVVKGSLHLKYRVVPLISSRLSSRHCRPLVERILSQLTHWSLRFLSYAGRLQLIKSVVFAIQNYWTAIFLFLKKVLENLDQRCSSFLWSSSIISRKITIAWKQLCCLKRQGGLGLYCLVDWNMAYNDRKLLTGRVFGSSGLIPITLKGLTFGIWILLNIFP